MNILVVDDSKFVRKGAKTMLEKIGHSVEEAEGGDACLARLSEGEIELVFLDWEMPEMDGVETLKALKAEHEDVEVIMMTGHSDMTKVMTAIELGALDFIIKPFTEETFREKIEEHF